MCLSADKDNPLEGKFSIKFDSKGYAKCWKSYDNGKKSDWSPKRKPGLYPTVCNCAEPVSYGEIVSNREDNCAGRDCRDNFMIDTDLIEINRGIHVFTRKKTAETHSGPHPNDRVVAVRCHESDLVAVDAAYPNAVFMKVLLSKKEYDKAMKV